MPLPSNLDISTRRIYCHSASVGTTPVAAYMLAPFAGSLTRVGGVINAAISGGDCSVAVAVNGTQIANSPFVITASGSGAGTFGSAIVNAGITEDDFISFTPSGASGAAVSGNFFAVCRRGRL
jgi:hypothetical protein